MSLPGKQKWPRALRGAPRSQFFDSENREKNKIKKEKLDSEENFVNLSKKKRERKNSGRYFIKHKFNRNKQRKENDE